MGEPERDAELREAARARLARGLLPSRAPVHTWGGPGTGRPCAICDLPVGAGDIEYELDFALATGPLTLRFHRHCHAIWDSERHPPEAPDGPRAR